MRYYFLSGILLGCVYIFPFELCPLVFIFLVPIIFAMEKNTFSVWQHLRNMFVFAFVASLFCFWSETMVAYPLDWLWVDNSYFSFFLVSLLWISMSGVVALSLSSWSWGLENLRKVYAPVAGAALWVVLEYVRSYFMFIVLHGKESLFGAHQTHGAIGYYISTVPFVKEALPVGGIYMAAFLIILINFGIYEAVSKKKFRLISLCIFLIIFISFVSYGTRKQNTETDSPITMQLGNAKFMAKDYPFLDSNKTEEASIELSKLDATKTDFVLLPENINVLNSKLNYAGLIIGSTVLDGYEKMYFYSPQSGTSHYYAKQLLMPIGEYAVTWLRLILPIFGEKWITLYNQNSSNYLRGRDEDNTFSFQAHGKNIVVAGTICAEVTSPYISRFGVEHGATLLVSVLSHASLHGSSIALDQAMFYYMTRSLETGRYLVGATNYNSSFVISDRGEIVDVIDTKGTEVGSVKFREEKVFLKNYKTLYVVYGDLIVLASILMLVYFFLYEIKNRE